MNTIVLIIFCFILLPFWLVLHYFTKWSSSRSLSKEETVLLEQLWRSAKSIEERITVLETILDVKKGVK